MRGFKERIKAFWFKGNYYAYYLLRDNKKACCYLDSLLNNANSFTADAEEWAKLGIMSMKIKRYDVASDILKRAVDYSAREAKYLYLLGKSEQQKGDYHSAEALFDEACKKDKDFYEALFSKGEIKFKRGRYQEALQCFQMYLKARKNDALALNNAGLSHLFLNELAEAEECFSEAVRLRPKDNDIIFNYATLFLREKKYKEAVKKYEMISGEGNIRVLCALGYCYGQIGEFTQSRSCYYKVLESDSKNREALLNLAVVCAKSGEKACALRIFTNLLQLNPEDYELLNDIAWVYEMLEDYEKAEEYYLKGLNVSAGDPKIAYNLVCCLDRQGKYSEAIDAAKYLKTAPDWQRTAWSSVARIYEKMGADSLAIYYYNRALGLE